MPKSKLELYKEYPDPDERKTIDAIIALLIGHLKIQYRDQPKLRDTHTKSNGLLKGRFQVLPNLPEELRVGLFSESRTYDCWIRFSNSDSFISNDKAKDFRGISEVFVLDGIEVFQDRLDAGVVFHGRSGARVWGNEDPIKKIRIEDAGRGDRSKGQRDDDLLAAGGIVGRKAIEIVEISGVRFGLEEN